MEKEFIDVLTIDAQENAAKKKNLFVRAFNKMNLFNKILWFFNLIICVGLATLFTFSYIHTSEIAKKQSAKLEKEAIANGLKETNYQTILQTYSYMEFKIFSFEKKYSDFAKIIELAFKNAVKNKLSPYTVIAIIQVESNFDPKAKSNKDAYGLMQVHYPTWKDVYKLKSPEELYNAELNMQLGCQIFKQYLDSCKGDISKALYLYNAGYVIGVENGYVESVNNSKFNSSNTPTSLFANATMFTTK